MLVRVVHICSVWESASRRGLSNGTSSKALDLLPRQLSCWKYDPLISISEYLKQGQTDFRVALRVASN